MSFLKNLFQKNSSSDSNLETLINKDRKSNDAEKEKIYLQVIEDFLESKSIVYLGGKDETMEVLFFKNTVMVGDARYAIAFTNLNEIPKWNKEEQSATKISTGQFMDLCLHFNIRHVVINIKSDNRYFFEFRIKKSATNPTRYSELCETGTDAYLSELEDVNWFGHDFINKEEIQKRIVSYEGTEELVLGLTQLEFDSEAFEDINHYKAHLNALLAFIPGAKLTIKNDGECYILDLTINNTSAVYKLKISNGGYQEGILDELFNPALGDSAYRFYKLPAVDQMIRLIYVPSTVYYAAQDKGLIPEENYFI